VQSRLLFWFPKTDLESGPSTSSPTSAFLSCYALRSWSGREEWLGRERLIDFLGYRSLMGLVQVPVVLT
jgi:hypothetical protein